MKNSRDLILGEVVSIAIIYHILDSLIYLSNSYNFSFRHMTGENREYNFLKPWLTNMAALKTTNSARGIPRSINWARRIVYVQLHKVSISSHSRPQRLPISLNRRGLDTKKMNVRRQVVGRALHETKCILRH